MIFVSSGVGGSLHMGAELFKIMADIDYKIVQFKGGGPAMTDLLGGHSQAFICSLIAAQPHIKSGKLKALGTGGVEAQRDPARCADHRGGRRTRVRDDQLVGLLAPAGTPAPIVARLRQRDQGHPGHG